MASTWLIAGTEGDEEVFISGPPTSDDCVSLLISWSAVSACLSPHCQLLPVPLLIKPVIISCLKPSDFPLYVCQLYTAPYSKLAIIIWFQPVLPGFLPFLLILSVAPDKCFLNITYFFCSCWFSSTFWDAFLPWGLSYPSFKAC